VDFTETGTRKATIYYGGFAFRGGGAFMHAQLLHKELERAGWNVRLITLEWLPFPLRYLPHIVSKVVNWFSSPMGFHYKGRVTRLFYKWFLNHNDDVKIFEDIYLSWNSRTPSVTLIHAVWSDNLQGISVSASAHARLIGAEERTIDSIAHPMITVSEPYRQLLADTHRGSRRLPQVRVVPLGLDIDEFDITSRAERSEKSLVYCGALEPRKNLGFLLDVFRNLHMSDQDYRLTIIGDGPDAAELERYVSEHALPVTFCGRLTRDSVIQELSRHAVYVHPSVKESFSFALLEGKVSGLTTVAFEGLEVPSEFIDVPVNSFDVPDWVTAVERANNTSPKPIDAGAYSAKRMMLSTLDLASGTIEEVS
jgi:glycosyltransferase involved in cell wall biosynthesis